MISTPYQIFHPIFHGEASSSYTIRPKTQLNKNTFITKGTKASDALEEAVLNCSRLAEDGRAF
jgi:hypothetical protein